MHWKSYTKLVFDSLCLLGRIESVPPSLFHFIGNWTLFGRGRECDPFFELLKYLSWSVSVSKQQNNNYNLNDGSISNTELKERDTRFSYIQCCNMWILLCCHFLSLTKGSKTCNIHIFCFYPSLQLASYAIEC